MSERNANINGGEASVYAGARSRSARYPASHITMSVLFRWCFRRGLRDLRHGDGGALHIPGEPHCFPRIQGKVFGVLIGEGINRSARREHVLTTGFHARFRALRVSHLSAVLGHRLMRHPALAIADLAGP